MVSVRTVTPVTLPTAHVDPEVAVAMVDVVPVLDAMTVTVAPT